MLSRTYSAPAKVNLTLEVLARRDDGYHALRSLMVPLALCDDITLEPAGRNTFECVGAKLAGPSSVELALAAAGCAPVRAVLRKEIPIGGGLGGGSSDAAA